MTFHSLSATLTLRATANPHNFHRSLQGAVPTTTLVVILSDNWSCILTDAQCCLLISTTNKGVVARLVPLRAIAF